jgi:hypothetical protein
MDLLTPAEWAMCIHLIAFLISAAGWITASTPQPGEPMPHDVRQRVDEANELLRNAMVKRDQALVNHAAARVQEALGPWLSVPERKPEYRIKPDARRGPSLAELKAVWDRAWPVNLKRSPVPDLSNPKLIHPLLRHPSYVILGGLAALKCDVGDEVEIRREVNARLGYLLRVQRPNGLFPFADLRGTDTKFAALLDNHYRIWPEDFDNGFVIEDHLDGGLQFDNGVCVVTMITAYEVLGDERYRQAASKACEWTLQRPIVVNWNYNAFSIWALSRYVRATADRSLIAPAIERLRLGVLPGQTSSGRWMDPHNARTVYHAIILRAMAELYAILDVDAEIRATLRQAIRRAERVLVDEIRTRGATDADHSLSALCAVDRAFGPDARRSEAICVLGNAIYAQVVDRGEKCLHDLTLFAVGELLMHEARSFAASRPGECK